MGCGLIGSRRAAEAVTHPLTELITVADTEFSRAQHLSLKLDCQAADDALSVISDKSIDVVVVSTPNFLTAPLAEAALEHGKHVLLEKPPGRNLDEALRIVHASHRARDLVVKVGFNHRYHPAIARAHESYRNGLIGDAINLRVRYGHGGRQGYEKEWRGSLECAGGGELTDQGIHVADLINWFLGPPQNVFSMLQTAIWQIAPLEDNAFALMRFARGAIASIHTSWTQWKNLFSFELFGSLGSLCVEGLAGSYGDQRLIVSIRRAESGPPVTSEHRFDSGDLSWKLEWQDFVSAVAEGKSYLGTADEGLAAMTMIDALYRSAREGAVIPIAS